MCLGQPSMPKPVVIPPPPPPPQAPAPADTGAASQQLSPQRADANSRKGLGISQLRTDLTIPGTGSSGNGLSIPSSY